MFILAHQFLGVSSENNRPDTYPAEFAQASRVQSVKHLVCKCHDTTERRLGFIAPHRPERGERTTSGPAPARANIGSGRTT